jgi:uncharacterized radical SAM superfamily Fe-S cluster-containing enzyme
VFLRRTCPQHGEASVCIASDARFYWLAQGKPGNACGCGAAGDPPGTASSHKFSFPGSPLPGLACCASDGSPAGTLGRNAEPGDALGIQEKLSTCLALIEIVRSCNLACPTCYADSPVGAGDRVDAVPLEDLKRRIQGVIDRKGGIEILQLSGGEPTLHPEFFVLLRWLHDHPGIDYVLLNTNGVRIANDDAFAAELREAFRYGAFQLYLQFDGPQVEGQQFLRGADLRSTRQRCLERCAEMNLPVTLAMTVTHDNLAFLWEAIEFGLRWPNVRGISFQPVFGSGRIPTLNPRLSRRLAAPESDDGGSQTKAEASTHVPGNSSLSPRLPRRGVLAKAGGTSGERVGERGFPGASEHSAATPPLHPRAALESLNTADIILAAVGQSNGQLRFEDFTPLPCGDPNCATIGYLLKIGGRVRSVSDFVDFTAVQGFLSDKVRYKLEDLIRCGCDSEPLGELLKQFELDETHTFRLFIKPFMDAFTWDEDRIDRCCTHVIRPDGKLDSFCRYYSGFADT